MDVWPEKYYDLELGLTNKASLLLSDLGMVLEGISKLG